MKTQLTNPFIKRLVMLLVPILTAGALTVAVQAKDRAAKIQGKGTVDMVASADTYIPVNGVPTSDLAYPINTEFQANHFAIKASVNADGSATGSASFVFGDEFNAAWGADAITLECKIDAGSVSADGTGILQGVSFEVDFDEFGNVIFEELSPFEIIIDPTGSFSLRWCAIPALDLEITKGHLKVK